MRAPILMYHDVSKTRQGSEGSYRVSPVRFAQHIAMLAEQGYRAVAIESLVNWLEGGPPLSAGDFVLTFDDGFRSVLDHALPVLERLDWPFTVFLVTDMLGGVDAWKHNDGTSGGIHPLLSRADVLSMRQRGASFHSHTRRHPSLPALDDTELSDELSGSRECLSAFLDQPDLYIAYPYGHVDDRVVAAARRAGFKAGFSVQSGFNRQGVDLFRIRRLDVLGTDTADMLLRKIRLGSNDGSRIATLRYYAGRIVGRFTARPT